jgi:hypothetical protein
MTGPAGPAGTAGPAGPIGPAGIAGPAGPIGPAGIAGPAGPIGPAGVAGPAGPVGPIGLPGVAGPIGLTGPAGPAGPEGPVGSTGAQGAQGPAGSLDPAQLATLNNDTTLITADDPKVQSAAAFVANYGVTSEGGGGNGCEAGNKLLGEIVLTAFNFGAGMPADGRILPIAQYQALFSLIGTTYGGDGMSTFAVPDLRAITPKNMAYSICAVGIFPSRN